MQTASTSEVVWQEFCLELLPDLLRLFPFLVLSFTFLSFLNFFFWLALFKFWSFILRFPSFRLFLAFLFFLYSVPLSTRMWASSKSRNPNSLIDSPPATESSKSDPTQYSQWRREGTRLTWDHSSDQEAGDHQEEVHVVSGDGSATD